MRRVVVRIMFAGAGFWLGSNRLMPLWSIVALAFLGAALWALVEWLEWREERDDDAS